MVPNYILNTIYNIVSFFYQIYIYLQDHTRFVQAVRYSPNGGHFASAGFDGKVFLYDGTSSELVSEIGSPAHKGGVYAVSMQCKFYLLSLEWNQILQKKISLSKLIIILKF